MSPGVSVLLKLTALKWRRRLHWVTLKTFHLTKIIFFRNFLIDFQNQTKITENMNIYNFSHSYCFRARKSTDLGILSRQNQQGGTFLETPDSLWKLIFYYISMDFQRFSLFVYKFRSNFFPYSFIRERSNDRTR